MFFGNTSPISSFYQRLMSLKGASDTRKRIEKVSETGESKDQFHRFLAVFEGEDADFFSNHKKQTLYFKRQLKGLSGEKLRQIKEKIKHITKEAFESREHSEKTVHVLGSVACCHIEMKLEESQKHTATLKGHILQRLLSMEGIHLTAPDAISYLGQISPIAIFADKHFADLIDAYNTLVHSDTIVPDPSIANGNVFVSHTIAEALR